MRVVFLHESPRSSAVFESVQAELSDLGSIAIDTPGYGSSDPPPGPRDIHEYGDALLSGLSGLGVSSVALAGVHTGASLAVAMAARAEPGLLSGLALSGVSLMTPERRAEFLAGWAPPVAVDDQGGHLGWAWSRYRGIYGESAPPDMVNDAVVELLASGPSYNWAYNASLRYDAGDDLRSLRLPVTFLTPEFDLLVEEDRRAVQIVPGATQRIFPGSPGQLPLRDPVAYADAVRSFLVSCVPSTTE